MFRLGMERNGQTYLSRFPHTNKELLGKLAASLNKRFPERKYIVLVVAETKENSDNVQQFDLAA